MGSKHPGALPEAISARQLLLTKHFYRTAAQLDKLSKTLASGPALNEQTKFAPELEHNIDELIDLGDQLVRRIRRIMSYLGIDSTLPRPNALDAVKQIRAYIQRGDSDDALAAYLVFYFRGQIPVMDTSLRHISALYMDGSTLLEHFSLYTAVHRTLEVPEGGRPRGPSDDPEIPNWVVLGALERHDSDPKQWSWPKVTDFILPHCKKLTCLSHEAHTWESGCTLRLKKAAERLRAFLRELQSTETTPPTVK